MSGMTLTMLSLFALMAVGVAASLISVRWSYRNAPRQLRSRRAGTSGTSRKTEMCSSQSGAPR